MWSGPNDTALLIEAAFRLLHPQRIQFNHSFRAMLGSLLR